MKEVKPNTMTMMIGVSVLIALVSFVSGMKFQQSKQPAFTRQFQNGNAPQGSRVSMGGNRAGFRPVAGEILTSDDSSITVKLQDGSSKIILITEKTEINKADAGKKEDLKIGEKVAIFGTDNSDGSVTAQNIQLNPMLRGMGGSPSATIKP